jgi:hypoxia up-regulated 1
VKPRIDDYLSLIYFQAVKFPAKAYGYLLSVIGKKIDHPHVKRYQQIFPYYTLKADPETGTVIFQHDEYV